VTDPTDVVQRLLAIEEIKRLKARYFRYLDTQRWEDWGQLFAMNAVMEVPEADIVNTGREEVVRNTSTALQGVKTVHHGHMPEIEITGPDTARGVWAMYDYVELPSADPGTRAGLHGYGHYLEEYTREDGQWRISRTRLERLRTDPLV
jgi:SnoaL-like protein